MFELPTSVTICDKEYPIRNKGDFRMILDCFACLQDVELDERERVITSLCIFYSDITSIDGISEVFSTEEALIEAVNGMYNFFNCGQKSVGAKQSRKLIDWEDDSQMIISAINRVAGKEVRAEEYVHWWTFMGYYLAIGECPLSTIVSIRDKIMKGKKLEKWESDFRKENPEYFIWKSKSVEDIEAEEYIRKIWNNGGELNG